MNFSPILAWHFFAQDSILELVGSISSAAQGAAFCLSYADFKDEWLVAVDWSHPRWTYLFVIFILSIYHYLSIYIYIYIYIYVYYVRYYAIILYDMSCIVLYIYVYIYNTMMYGVTVFFHAVISRSL